MNDIKGIIEDVEKSSLVSNKVIDKVVDIIGQEKWNDIYDEEDDICTTTGELIITLKGIAEFEKDNKELKKQLFTAKNEQNAFKIYSDGAEEDAINLNEQLTKAKEIILKLYNAGRDVLMCRAEEKAYDNLSNAINDKSIEQFLNSLK